MSDLEAFGHHVGSVRALEPVTVLVSCHIHKYTNRPVGILPDECVAVCCLFAELNVPYALKATMAMSGANWFLEPRP